jgi:Flp pilus assembly protein TadG
VIVEAAIIIPLLLMLTFGAIEYGIAFRDAAAVAASSRSGARLASTLSTADDITLQQNVALAVSDSLHDLINGTPTYLVIYRANSNGDAASGSLTAATPTCDDCWIFSWNAGNPPTVPAKWVLTGGAGTPWTKAERQAAVCKQTTLPSIGIYVRATQKGLTGLFGGNKTTDQKTAMRLEPPSTDECA